MKDVGVKINQPFAGCVPENSLRFWLTRKLSIFFFIIIIIVEHVGSIKDSA